MNKKQIIKYLHSLILLPSFFLPFSNMALDNGKGIATLLNPKENIEINKESLTSAEESKTIQTDKEVIFKRGQKIDAYFKSKGLPLAGYGQKMAEEADKHNIDWRIIPAIAMRESTGGKFACKSVPNSPFGWGSCKIGFKTLDLAIEKVAYNLGGKNPKTASYYDGELTEVLENYNGRAVPYYAEEVIAIMNKIGDEKGLS